MAGSPKKRARREAARLAKLKESTAASSAKDSANIPAGTPASISGQTPKGELTPVTLAPLKGEVLPPLMRKDDEDAVTRTAKKRAMRRLAQEHAEKAIRVIASNMDSQDPEIAAKAANDMLKWAGLDKVELNELNGEGMQIVVLKFGEHEAQ